MSEPLRSQPAVSVCITSYNHAVYLPATLDSVLAQTFQDFEILIADDGSTDESLAVLDDYRRRYPDKIRCFWHPDHVNRGISPTFNLAARNARGTYLAWLGSDDLWLPEKLAQQVQWMDAQPDVGVVYSPAYILDSAGRQYPMLTVGGEQFDDVWRRLLVSNFICASSVLIRRSCLDDVGLLDENLVYSDWELWIRIAARYRIGIVSQPLVLYRIHGQNISVSSRPVARLERRTAVIESVFAALPADKQPLKREALAAAYFEVGLDLVAAGQHEEGRRYLAQADLDRREDDLVESVVAYVAYTLRTHGWDVDRCARFIREVFAAVRPQETRKAIARLYATEVLLHHSCGSSAEVRRYMFPAIARDPGWLRNGGFVSAGLEAIAGAKLAGILRRLARRIRGA